MLRADHRQAVLCTLRTAAGGAATQCENRRSALIDSAMLANPLFRPGVPDAPSAVPSPCVSVCRMDPRSGWCEGCRRTIDEIAAWSRLDDAGKRVILARLDERRLVAGGASAGERA